MWGAKQKFAVCLITIGLMATFSFVYDGGIRVFVANAQEAVMLSVDSSVERMYSYGDKYLNAENGHEYSIEKAERYYQAALRADGDHPYVHHQLARIYFLKGDFARALTHINTQIELHPGKVPAAHYIRALIYGFMGQYDLAVRDYETYIGLGVHGWAASNDYAWVLLKSDRPNAAIRALSDAVDHYPDNPWLLNSLTIALYEAGHIKQARMTAEKAVRASFDLTKERWLSAYPGNDPRVALEGVLATQEAARSNMHSILRDARFNEIQ